MYRQSNHNMLMSTTVALLSILFILIINSCSSVKVSDVRIKNIHEYKLNDTKNNIDVAVEPIFEKSNNEELFGADLISYGVLPIFIYVKNHNQRPILIERQNISLMNNKNEAIQQLTATQAKNPIDKERWDIDKTFGIIYNPITLLFIIPPVAIIPGIAFDSNKYFNAEVILPNMSKKALFDRTINSEEVSHGFVYFHIKDKDLINAIEKINIDIKDVASDTIYNYSFTINK